MSASGPNLLLRYLRRLGAGSLFISILIHVIVALLATFYVISSVKQQRQAIFQGGSGQSASSTVEHRVQMSHHQPNLPTLNQRLSVDSPNTAVSLPDLPDLPSFAAGGPARAGNSGGSGGDFGAGAGMGKGPAMPTFGFREARPGGSLIGYFYDFKQLAGLKPNPDLGKFQPGPLAEHELSAFTQTTWQASALAKFYRAPTPLYATQIFIPNMTADEAPKAYGVEKHVQGRAWAVHYRGRVSPPVNGTYRFVGGADDFLVVRLDGRLVLDGGLFAVSKFKSDLTQPRSYAYNFGAPGNNLQKSRRGGFVVGQKMDLRAGLFYDIDIVMGEGLGGHFYAFLYFEKEGETYAKDGQGNPILPIFRVADNEPPPAGAVMPVFLANGPVWRALPPSL